MALCGITQGFNFNCLSLKRVSGVRRLWAFNIDDLTTGIDPNGTGYVSGLEFNGYDGLYEFESRKFSHQFTHNLVVAESGAASWTQTGVIRVFVDTPDEVAALSDLSVSNVGFIVLTNNSEFRIYGAENGMTAGDGTTGTTGRLQGEDTTDQVTMIGSEKLPYRILLKTDYNTTLALVEALEF
jgi:hypothetical protein